MNDFHFKVDDESELFLNEIVDMLIAFGGKTQSESIVAINTYWKAYTDIRDVGFLFAETPYYWAMCMLHHPVIGDGDVFWYLDSMYMPPPKWVRDRYYSRL